MNLHDLCKEPAGIRRGRAAQRSRPGRRRGQRSPASRCGYDICL